MPMSKQNMTLEQQAILDRAHALTIDLKALVNEAYIHGMIDEDERQTGHLHLNTTLRSLGVDNGSPTGNPHLVDPYNFDPYMGVPIIEGKKPENKELGG